ncbi:MAG: helix-turn-helix transcriptional regulator, partial [Anaerolineales bacterium]|nr:helix-turn-helix transcriptional regulator [Anaerolineales bacterium]
LLGFSEPSAFSKAFKKWSGMTPREYRERSCSSRLAV